MLIKKIRLQNIRSYVDQEIVFPAGSVLLSGDIGSGKSTILLAIEFAFFGADTEKLSGGALLRKGAMEGSVELTFNLSDKEIVLKRGIKRSKSTVLQTSGSLRIDGIQKDVMPIELKTEVIALLGYPDALVTRKRNLIYRYTVYCPQEEMKAILTDEKESRLDTLRKIFGVDKYKRVRENCAILEREMRVRQREMEVRVEDLPAKKVELGEYRDAFHTLDMDILKLSPLLELKRADLTVKRDELVRCEGVLKHLESLRRQSEILTREVELKKEILEKNNGRMHELTPIMQESLPESVLLRKQIEVEESVVQQLRDRRTVVQQQMKDVEQRMLELQRELTRDISADLEKKRRLHTELTVEIDDKKKYVEKKAEYEETLANLRGVLKETEVRKFQSEETRRKILTLALCPTCLQGISKEHKERVCDEHCEITEQLTIKIAQLRTEIGAAEGAMRDVGVKLDFFMNIEKRLVFLSAELAQLDTQCALQDQKRARFGELQTLLVQMTAEAVRLDSLDRNEQALRQLKVLYERASQRERAVHEHEQLMKLTVALQTDISGLTTRIAVIREEYTALAPTEDRMRLVKRDMDIILAEERQLAVDFAGLLMRKRDLSVRLTEAEADIQEKDLILNKLTMLKQQLHWFEEYFHNVMITIEKHVMVQIYHEFNELVRAWFAILIADENMVARIDDGFQPVIEQQGYEVDISFLSGGERTSVALAYRLALHKVVNDIISTIKTKGILILDEPTEGFSSEQLDRVREVLDELNMRQIIIVSHESKVESFVDTIIRVSKTDGVSRVCT